MQFFVIQRIFGILMMLSSITMLPPVVVAWGFGDGHEAPFLWAFLVALCAGFLLWLPVRRKQRELKLRDGFVVVVMFWTVLGFSGAMPLMLAIQPHLTLTEAVFESVSGLTTTGATTLIGIDQLPHSVLFYRQELQWLGGMGIIVLAVAVLPMLGIGGMQLYRAETPGPMKDSKLTPRIAETAKALWYIYLGLTAACATAYWLAGMNGFDAIAHSFSTVSIGGFSTHNESIGYFNNTTIEIVAMIFIVISGVNFSLHFLALREISLRHYWRDSEFKAYLFVLFVAAVIVSTTLYSSDKYPNWVDAFHNGFFQTISIGTTTGFTTAQYSTWSGFVPVLLLLISFIGGCAGSTGGGMKVIRMVLLLKQGGREIKRLVHPKAEIPVKIGGNSLNFRVMDAVWGFFSLYVTCFCVMSLMLAATGLDLVTAFSSVAACMNNMGPALGEAAANYADINVTAKWILCFAMLLGRLEIFTLLVILTPAFWRH